MIYLKNSVGVEIRDEDLVITCLSSNFSAGVFTHFKRVADFRTRPRGEVRAEIDQFFRTRKLGRDSLVVGIPREDALLRQLDFPREVEDNLAQVLLYQVQSFEPSEDEKFYHDYVLTNPKQPGKRLQVLLVMVRRATLDAELGLLGELGIVPVGVTVGSLALANLFLQVRPDAAGRLFVLADVKPKSVEILGVRDGNLIYSRETSRTDGEGWQDLFGSELEVAAARMRLGPEDSIEELVLAGEEAGAAQSELRESIPDCKRLAPLLRFEMALGEQAHVDEGAASLGLASTGIARRLALPLNLLPPGLRVPQTRWVMVPSIVLGVVIAALGAGFAFRPAVQERIMIRQIDDQLRQLQGPVARVQALEREAQTLEKRIGYLERIVKPRDMNLEVLQELTTLLPPDTFLNLYENREGAIRIAGSSASASDLMPKLERSPWLKSVQQRGTVFKDAQTGKDRFNFEAKLEKRE